MSQKKSKKKFWTRCMLLQDANKVYEINSARYANAKLQDIKRFLQTAFCYGYVTQYAGEWVAFGLVQDIFDTKRTQIVNVEEMDIPYAKGAAEHLLKIIVRRARAAGRIVFCDIKESDLESQILLKTLGFWCHVAPNGQYRFVYPKEASKSYREFKKQNQGTPKSQGEGHCAA